MYAGQTITADAINTLQTPPVADLTQTVVQSIATGTWAVITFDTEVNDPANGHSTSVNTSRYTCVRAGWYRIEGRAAFAANATGSRGARVHLNGSSIQGAATLCGAGTLAADIEVSHQLQLAVGDYIEIAGGQNSGGSLSTAYAGESASKMYVEWIRE